MCVSAQFGHRQTCLGSFAWNSGCGEKRSSLREGAGSFPSHAQLCSITQGHFPAQAVLSIRAFLSSLC